MFEHTQIGLALTCAIVLTASPGMAEEWPSRPVSLVVPFAAGSASDTAGRILAAGLSGPLGQQVIVENVGGAGGMTGTARVANAPPDGYQFTLSSVDTMAMNQTLYKKPLYNSVTDFTPIGLVIDQPIILIARADLPANSMREFISYAKANQGKMQFGSAGPGSGSHLACARVNAAIGAEPAHVPYRGSAQAMQDLAAGRIDFFCALGAAAVAPLASKTAKPIAILTRERSPLFSDIPTANEEGLAGVESYFWSGFFFPKNTPDDIVKKMSSATAKTLDSQATQDRLKKAGVTVVGPERRSPEYLKTFIGSEIANWATTIKSSGVSLD
jgi:tripartite-type tricarboxylate transporter receptor subunit TctC